MLFLDHEQQPIDVWREGVKTRMRTSILNGAAQLCQFEQWCTTGHGAPTHLHAVEEILTVLEGEAEIWVEDERKIAGAGHSVVIPAGRKHGFRNVGSKTLHVLATLAAPIFEATFDDQKELSRRWVPRAASDGA
jgi:quercetin dioxygenase-like cupin family protein